MNNLDAVLNEAIGWMESLLTDNLGMSKAYCRAVRPKWDELRIEKALNATITDLLVWLYHGEEGLN